MPQDSPILIAGVGNLLLSDDGVGVHAVREMQKQASPGVRVVDIGTATLHGLHFLEGARRVLVIDAARGGQPPGTVYQYDPQQHGRSTTVSSIHAMGLVEASRLLPPHAPLPAFTILGVEPATLDYGLELSGPVQAALPQIISLARQIVGKWLEQTESASIQQLKSDVVEHSLL